MPLSSIFDHDIPTHLNDLVGLIFAKRKDYVNIDFTDEVSRKLNIIIDRDGTMVTYSVFELDENNLYKFSHTITEPFDDRNFYVGYIDKKNLNIDSEFVPINDIKVMPIPDNILH